MTGRPYNRRPTLRGLALAIAIAASAHAQNPPALPVRHAPVSPNASREATALLEFFHSVSGKWILAGQQETVDWFGADNAPEFPYVLEKTGKEPAVRGFDFMFMSDDRNTYQRVAERMIAWSARGGIVTSCFHWFAGPTGVYSGTPRQAFYTTDTNFDLNQALIAGTANNTEFIAEMDEVAEELKKVRDAGVPVLWRPFHECSGGWFWWGAKGAAAFKQAWIFMFERFTQVHGLNNLIWVYNPTDAAGALASWYPGDAYVDMVTLDIYPATGTHPTYATQSTLFRNLTNGAKPIALSENGAIPGIDQLFTDGATWTYFCTWNGSFTTDGVVNPVSFLQQVYNHPRVITLDEIGQIRPRTDLAPSILIQPAPVSAPAGATIALTAVAAGSAPLGYQWKKDGVDIAGATEARLRLASLSASDSAAYTVEITNANGAVTSNPAAVALASGTFTAPASRLTNISTRGQVASASGSEMIAGFVIGGPGAKRVLLRAVGPSLGTFGVQGTLADPQIRLADGDGRTLATNDDWTFGNNGAALQIVYDQLGAFQLPGATRDAVLLADLPPGSYTAIVSGVAASAGVALVEIYDADTAAASRLVNLSTRGPVGTGESVMIAGFVIEGTAAPQLLARGVGPALGAFGVANTLSDPLLTLTRADGTFLLDNDDWDTTADLAAVVSATQRVGAFDLTIGAADAALLTTQPPGGYTATVRGAGGTTGNALAEIYEVPAP